MSPLEFRQYLHGLGLNHQNVSALVGVQDRTVRRWASGRIDIPEDVSSLLLELDASVTKAVSERLQNIDPRPDFFDIPEDVSGLLNSLWDAIDRRVGEAERLEELCNVPG